MAPRLFACFGRGSSSSAPNERKATADSATEENRIGGPIVVELFSSQGCGTSPEAESVVTRLGRGEIADVPVLILAFHVDYWDYRGWKDPFGASAWTVRQKAYVESMRLDTLYTPQIVVQGRAQCLGNEEGSIAAAVSAAPRFPSPTMKVRLRSPSLAHLMAIVLLLFRQIRWLFYVVFESVYLSKIRVDLL